MKRFTKHKELWGEFIDPKINAYDLVKYQEKYKNKRILIGSVTDPYCPVEKKYKITRNILKKLIVFDSKIEILTKSKLVLRDIDLLKRFNDVVVGLSVSVINDKLSHALEPKATIGRYRLKVSKQLSYNGIKTYVFISPIIPGITEIKNIIKIASPYVEYLMFENLNMRANNKDGIFKFIKKYKPELLGLYNCLYNDKKYSYEYWLKVQEKIKMICLNEKKEARIYFQHENIL